MAEWNNMSLTARISILLVLTTTTTLALIHDYPDYCLLDDDSSNPTLDSCLQQGEAFLAEYTRQLKRGKLTDTCKLFAPFSECITPLLEECPSVRHVLHSHWRPVIHLMHCSCNNTHQVHECHHKMQCFEKEYSSPMLQSCDTHYRMNKKQKTHSKCHFLRESIHCKEALIRTACGEDTGNFGHHFSKLLAREDIEKLRCYVHNNKEYQGFSYDEKCPRELQDDLAQCQKLHPPHQWLKFDPKYTYIPKEGQRRIHKTCKTYTQYKYCLEPYVSRCPEGVNRLHAVDGRLRNYIIKMDYICTEALTDYSRDATCLKDVLRNASLQCPLEGLSPFEQSVTSYQFYCNSSHKQVLAMQQELEIIRSCIETHFSRKCGSASGSTISELIRRVFADPFEFLPNCRDHKPNAITAKPAFPIFNMPISPTTTQAPPVAKSRTHRVVAGESSPSSVASKQDSYFIVMTFVTAFVLLSST